MKKNKKIILSFIIMFVMSFVFTACGENSKEVALNNNDNSVSQQSDDLDSKKDNLQEKNSKNNKKDEKGKQQNSKSEVSKEKEKSSDKLNTDNSSSSKKSDIKNKQQTGQSKAEENKSNKPQQSPKPQPPKPQPPKPQPPKPEPPKPQPPKPQPPKPEPVKQVYLTIDCKTILNNMENLTPGKESLVPKDGYILYKTAVTFKDGENVFDVLLRETRARGIHMEYEYTPGFGSQYIEGINNLYEFDCGPGSGWIYHVNGVEPNYGVSKYILKEGDNIELRYTCDTGFDL